MLDLRPLPAQEKTGGVPEGYGLFAYAEEQDIPGSLYLGSDVAAELSAHQIDELNARLEVNVTETTLKGIVCQLLTDPAMYDPTGQARWRPKTIGSDGFFRVKLVGIEEKAHENHPAFLATMAARRSDYKKNREAGIPLDVLQRWTGYDMQLYYGRIGDDLVEKLVPQEYIADGWKAPETTFGDTFTDTNGTSLESHTPTGSNAGSSWVLDDGVAGSVEIQSNTAREDSSASGINFYRLNDSLSSDDHYAQAVISALDDTGADRFAYLAVRKAASSTLTFYQLQVKISNANGAKRLRMFRFVSGTGTQLATLDLPINLGDTVKFEADGDNLNGYINGVLKLSFDDV